MPKPNSSKSKKKTASKVSGGWRKAKKLLLAVPFAAAYGVYAGYINTGADNLRVDIYQPLYKEIATLDQSLQANNFEQNYSSDALESLKRNGNLLRIPKSLQAKILLAYDKTGQVRGHVFPVLQRIAIIVPAQVNLIRNQGNDLAWADRAVKQLNTQNDPNLLGMISSTFRHAGHSPALDVRDPKHIRISSPGSITWQINDWLLFPKSAADVTEIWTEPTYLTFDEQDRYWQYRITRDDLALNRLTLEEFLKPLYQQLSNDPDFQHLMHDEKDALAAVNDVKLLLGSRVEQPKQWRDIFD
jgi:hypothetical protein